tara:strand:+ start:52 stop:552 length:501 start_codon:yes stop_codon:yes gene_type:complete
MVHKCPEKRRQYKQEHHQKTKKKKRKQQNQLKDKRKIFILEEMQKRGNKCAKCGFSDIRALDWHHLDPSKKVDSISNLERNRVSMNKLQSELDKCELVCANCHRIEEERLGNWTKNKIVEGGMMIQEAVQTGSGTATEKTNGSSSAAKKRLKSKTTTQGLFDDSNE